MVFSLRPQFLGNQITNLEQRKHALSEEVNQLLRKKKELNADIVSMNKQISLASEKLQKFAEQEAKLESELTQTQTVKKQLLAKLESVKKEEVRVKQLEDDSKKLKIHAQKYLDLAKTTLENAAKREKELYKRNQLDAQRHSFLVSQFTAFKTKDALYTQQQEVMKKQHFVLVQKEKQLRALASDLAKYQKELHEQRVELDKQRKELHILQHSK